MITCYFENSNQPVHLRHVVVDMLVIKERQILLVKRGGEDWFMEKGKWALPGGYLDRDETGKQAAVREVREETGYETKVIRLLWVNDNPYRPNESWRQNVALIYLMKPLKKVGEHDHEISEARWFDLDHLPPAKKMAFDHLETIEKYQASLDK
jgi:8-oxo-dGTP diphosphatase